MDHSEIIAKLKYYHAAFGDWVYTTTAEKARERASKYRQDAQSETNCLNRLSLLAMAVQFEVVADCHDMLGDDVPKPPAQPSSLNDYYDKREALREKSIADEVVSECEQEIFTLSDLTRNAVKPEFQRGDPVWTPSFADDGSVEGYIPATIVGIELYPDEIFYMIGFYDEMTGEVTTTFESVDACDVFKEMPQTLDPYTKPRSGPQLHIVK